MTNKVRFNGTEYSSPNDMPPAIRAAYDKALELAAQSKSDGLLGGRVNVKVSTKVRFVHDGKTYESPDQMPPEVRAKYDKAMEQIDKDHNGVPDILENNADLTASNGAAAAPDPFAATDRSSLQPLVPTQPVISSDPPGNRTLLTVAGIVIVILLLAVIGLLTIVLRH